MAYIWHSEGDSISTSGTWQGNYRLQSGIPWTFHNYAVNGATITGNGGNSLTGRQSTVTAAFSPGDFNLLTVYIGANDFHTNVSATNDADMAALALYCSQMRAAGFYIALATMTPQASPETNFAIFNDNRAIYNPQYRALLGTSVHAILDLAADSVIGPDGGSPYTTGNAAADSTLYSSGVHPTALGMAHVARVASIPLETFLNAATGLRRFRLVF